MLILNRKAGESLQIGEDITVTVVSLDSGRVKLAISAPKSVPILRQELITATTIANQDASKEESDPVELLSMLRSVLDGEPPSDKIKKEKGVMSQ